MPFDQSSVSIRGSTSKFVDSSSDSSSSSKSKAEPYSADQGSSVMEGRVEAGDSNMISDFTAIESAPQGKVMTIRLPT